MFEKIGFIGTGNMGAALSLAAAKSGRPSKIFLANRTAEKAEKVKEKLSAACEGLSAEVTDNSRIAAEAELIVLAVKPQMMGEMLAGIRNIFAARADRGERFVLITVAAGLTAVTIQQMAGGKYPVIRIMPNTPAAIGEGVIQYAGLDVTGEETDSFLALFSPAGLLDPLPEKLIDAASAVSGCGPAFAYMFIEALADGAVACGLPRDKAVKYAAQMLKGSAALVLETGEHPGVLKDAVCSPGGTTIQGVRTLEEEGFRGAAMDAVIAAYEKTLKLK